MTVLPLTQFSNASNVATLKNKVIIPLNNWSSQRVISKAIGSILQANNYQVEYKAIDSHAQWGALARGLVHFQIEVWEPSMAEQSQPFLSKRSIVDLGSHRAKAIEDWWYPNYVETWCPGLPDWRALNNCSALFSQTNSKKGTYYTGPWLYRDPDLIRSLNLNFNIVRFDDDQSIWKKLASAKAAKKPIVMLNWSPNWTDVRVPGQFVEFPAYSTDCERIASWGVNPNQLYDCGNKRGAWIKKLAWSGLEKNLPCVQSFIQQMSLSNEMIAEAAALVDYDKLTEEKSVESWLEKYAGEITQWSDNSCIGAA